MSSVSGLSPAHRARARAEILRCVRLMASNRYAVHYTMGPRRWDGIDHRKAPGSGSFFPFWGDCSSTGTYLLWRGLRVGAGRSVRDLVNDTGWRAGYTGTMIRHGKPVVHDRNLTVGDQVFYGRGPTYSHVATYIGNGKVFSHGNEAGPVIVSMDYRLDRGPARRYI